MPRLRGSANDRPRVRLLSTPHPEGTTMATIAGVKFSDTLAALLDHAHAHDFRVEPDTRGKTASGVVVYPPSKDHGPITVSERGARFNKAHYENLKRDLYRAGCPPLPADAPSAEPEGQHPTPHLAMSKMVGADLVGPNRARVIGDIVSSLFTTANLDPLSSLASALTFAVASWAETDEGRALVITDDRLLAEAMTMVQEADAKTAAAEATATRQAAALAKADAATTKAREDCAAALRRAEVAEAEAARLDAALAPLRALIGGS